MKLLDQYTNIRTIDGLIIIAWGPCSVKIEPQPQAWGSMLRVTKAYNALDGIFEEKA